MGTLVAGKLSEFDRVGTGVTVKLADPSCKLSGGAEKDVVSAGKLKETELPGNEPSEIEPIVREDNVCRLSVGGNVVLSDKPSESNEDKVGKNEVPPNSTLDKLVVNESARSLVGIPPGVVKLRVVIPGAVTLTESEGTEKLPVRMLDEKEGKFDDRLVGNPSEVSERLSVDSVGSTEPTPNVPSDESPG